MCVNCTNHPSVMASRTIKVMGEGVLVLLLTGMQDTTTVYHQLIIPEHECLFIDRNAEVSEHEP